MHRQPRRFAIVAVVSFAVISTPMFAQVAPVNGGVLLPEVITINNQPGEHSDPHVDGDVAVYSSTVIGQDLIQTVQYYQFSTGIGSTIPQEYGPSTYIYDLLSGVDQGRIVFTRIFDGPAGTDRTAIMLFDIATGTLQELAPRPDSLRWGAALGAQTVAFADVGPSGDLGTSEIMVLDLATSELTRLTDNTAGDYNPNVSPDGNAVVWEHCPNAATCDIWGATRVDGVWTTRALATSALNEANPDTNGVDVVFERDNFFGPTGSNIVLVPLDGGPETELEIAGEQFRPRMHGSVITFESLVGQGSSDISVYDRLSHTFFQITQTPTLDERLSDVTVLPTGELRVVWAAYQSVSASSIHAATFTLPTTNSVPTANAGPDQLAIAGRVVTLAGAGADADGDPLTYAWALTGAPAGSAPSLSSSTLANATFVPDRPGVYTAQLTVSDPFGSGLPDTVQITATTGAAYAENLLQEAGRLILGLPAAAVTTGGNQNALIQFLSHVIVALQSGDLVTARQQLGLAISRADGCALRGLPDGNGPSRDWITTCAAQSQVYPLLVDALAAITP